LAPTSISVARQLDPSKLQRTVADVIDPSMVAGTILTAPLHEEIYFESISIIVMVSLYYPNDRLIKTSREI